MKRNVKLAMAIFVVLGLLFSTLAVAAEKGAQGTLQGMVEKGNKGITMLKTDDGRAYTILNKNMADMIGKKVKVTGTVNKGTKKHSVIVTSFEEVQN